MNLTWRSTLKVLACLVLGFALGVFFCHWKGASRFTDPEKRAEYVLNKFSDQLDLNPDQKRGGLQRPRTNLLPEGLALILMNSEYGGSEKASHQPWKVIEPSFAIKLGAVIF